MPMRILHLSTFDQSGGAARAAWNLCLALRDLGCESRMLVRDRTSRHDAVLSAPPASPAVRRRHHEASFVQRKFLNPARSPVSNTWFSLPEPGWALSGHPEVQAADILHLHWVSGFLSPASIGLLQRIGKPLVWTLHDQRPFTGGCHFSAGCRRFENDCDPCPQLTGEAMFSVSHAGLAESLRQLDPLRLTLVSPSGWMAECARRSALFCKSRVKVLPNSVDTLQFKPRKVSIRAKLGWPEQAVVLLAGADASGELRKGFSLLLEALRICGKHEEFSHAAKAGLIRLASFGQEHAPDDMPLPVHCLGRIDSPERLSEVYSAADAFMLPSFEDNLPNTMLEALCCGTPVIGFRIGGVPDGVTPGENGWLVEDISAAALARVTKDFCLDPARRNFDRASIARTAAARFNMRRQAEECLALYRELKAHKPVPMGASSAAAETSPAYEREFSGLLEAAQRARRKQRWARLARWMRFGREHSDAKS